MTLEPYQERAIEWLRRHKRGILRIPAGGGKTVTACAALNRLIERGNNLRIGWLAPTIETKSQAEKTMLDFPLLRTADIVTACAGANVDMRERNLLVVDECKHAAAPSWKAIIEQCPARWGLDATPFGRDSDRNNELRALFGNDIFTITREEVGARLVNARVIILTASSDVRNTIDQAIATTLEKRKRFSRISEQELWAQVAWQACIEHGIVNNTARNEAIVATATNHANDQILILVNQVEHGTTLAAQIHGAELAHSGIGRKNRRDLMQRVKDAQCKCLIATSLADEGLDLPCLNVLILASGGRSQMKAEQRTGRVLRTFGEKKEGIVYDFADWQHPLMAKHSKERLKLYKTLGYTTEPEAIAA